MDKKMKDGLRGEGQTEECRMDGGMNYERINSNKMSE